MAEQLPKEPLRRARVALLLCWRIEHLPVLVHRPPAIHRLRTDARERLVQLPRSARPRLALPQLGGGAGTGFDHPGAERLGANRRDSHTAWAITAAWER